MQVIALPVEHGDDAGRFDARKGTRMEGHCRARLATVEAALEYGDLTEAMCTLTPLWRCSTYSDCRLRRYCADRVETLTERVQTLKPVAYGNA